MQVDIILNEFVKPVDVARLGRLAESRGIR
jgi:hypothetical protein